MSDIVYNENGVARALEVKKVAGALGGTVFGVDLAFDLLTKTIAAIRQALLTQEVIFFCGQEGFNDTWQKRRAEKLCGPIARPTIAVAAGSRYILEVHSNEGEAASSWHMDITFLYEFPAMPILRGIDIPEWGGNTLWANALSADETLPAPLKILTESLHAIHTNKYDYAEKNSNLYACISQGLKHYNEVFVSTVYKSEHPIVHVYPENGERASLTGHFISHFAGLNETLSDRIPVFFQQHLTSRILPSVGNGNRVMSPSPSGTVARRSMAPLLTSAVSSAIFAEQRSRGSARRGKTASYRVASRSSNGRALPPDTMPPGRINLPPKGPVTERADFLMVGIMRPMRV